MSGAGRFCPAPLLMISLTLYLYCINLSDVKEGFADLLTRLHTDYIDVGMIHYIDSIAEWDKVANNGILDYAVELKSRKR